MGNINSLFLSAGALSEVRDKMLSSVKSTGGEIISLIKGIFDYTVIPISALAVLGVIFFLVVGIAKSKRRRDGEDLEEQVKNLIIAVVVLLLVVGYGSFAWGLL